MYGSTAIHMKIHFFCCRNNCPIDLNLGCLCCTIRADFQEAACPTTSHRRSFENRVLSVRRPEIQRMTHAPQFSFILLSRMPRTAPIDSVIAHEKKYSAKHIQQK